MPWSPWKQSPIHYDLSTESIRDVGFSDARNSDDSPPITESVDSPSLSNAYSPSGYLAKPMRNLKGNDESSRHNEWHARRGRCREDWGKPTSETHVLVPCLGVGNRTGQIDSALKKPTV